MLPIQPAPPICYGKNLDLLHILELYYHLSPTPYHLWLPLSMHMRPFVMMESMSHHLPHTLVLLKSLSKGW